MGRNKSKGKTLKYFRHPYLHTGPDIKTKNKFERFLVEHHYEIAPVTIDNAEWIYAFAYKQAKTNQDLHLMDRIGSDYINYMETIFDFYEELSKKLLERELAQILLIHANDLNADYFDELINMIKGRGYHFVTLEHALRDSAYSLVDNYIGDTGISWLQRWWISQGGEFIPEPQVPEWVEKIAYAKH